MMKFDVKYEDGTADVYVVKPKHILKAERTGGVEANIESTYRLAYLASGSKKDFDDWLDDVEEINPVDIEGDVESDLPTTGE